jgi:hypothetical protein
MFYNLKSWGVQKMGMNVLALQVKPSKGSESPGFLERPSTPAGAATRKRSSGYCRRKPSDSQLPPVVVLRDTTTGIGQRQFLSQAGKLSSYRVKFKGQWDRVAGLRR